MRKLYVCGTRVGPIYIVLAKDGQFHPYYKGETLTAYSNPEQAVDDIAGGRAFSIMAGLELRIPRHLADWERC
jgi:hypothetical protein